MSIRLRLTGLAMVVALAAGTAAALAGPSATAAAGTPNCRPSQITISTGVANGAAGTIYIPLVFTNHAGACALWGVPSVQPVGKDHRAIGPAARNDSMGQMPARHVLGRAHSVASAFGVAETPNYPVSRCHARTVWGVKVSLGAFAGPRYVPLAISVCTSLASTHVQLVVPGRTGVPTA